jgi:hypothetical protein
MSSVHRGVVAVALLLLWTVVVVQAQEESAETKVCAGLRKNVYSSERETNADPCQFSCSYDEATGLLLAQCRYDYCPSCDDQGVCGIREIQVNTMLDSATVQAVVDGGALVINDTFRYCIDYTEGQHSTKMVCAVVDTAAFASECGAIVQTGIPMTTCDATGCECQPTTTEPDYTSAFVGFQTIDFAACYSGSAARSASVMFGAVLVGAASSLLLL